MSRVVFSDWSDNQNVMATIPDDGAILKLYPKTNGRGWTWLTAQWPLLRGASKFVKGFYAADSTPTWSSAKAAAADLGVDLNAHPFAFDLREFGFSQAYVKGQVTNAHKDGQVKVGHYWRLAEEVGQDWRWKADYSGTPVEPWLVHQYTDSPWDRSHTHDGVTVDEFLAATTQGGDMKDERLSDADVTALQKLIPRAGQTRGVVEAAIAATDGTTLPAEWAGPYAQKALAAFKSGAGGISIPSGTSTTVTLDHVKLKFENDVP